jgi:hypothetical protein
MHIAPTRETMNALHEDGVFQSPVRSLRRVPKGRDLAEIEGPAARVGALAQAAARRIRSQPLASAVWAFGIGFVVGGALSFRAGRIALAVAVRHVARELLKQVL